MCSKHCLTKKFAYAGYTASTDTAAVLYKIDKVAVGHAVKDDKNVVRMLKQRTKVMNTNVWEMLSSNIALKTSSMEMLVEFSSILSEEKILRPGTIIDCAENGFLVTDGTIHFLLDATICDSDHDLDGMDLPEQISEGNEDQDSGDAGDYMHTASGTASLKISRTRYTRSTGGKNVHAEVISSPNFLSGTIELLAKSGSLRSVSSAGTSGKHTFRGSRRSLFLDEEAYAGAMIMDVNSFLLQESSNIQCECIKDSKIRTFERHAMLRFLHKYPGLMVRLLDSVMSNAEQLFS